MSKIRVKEKEEDKELKVSFISKKDIICPSCNSLFHKEELHTGGGRLIAGALTVELHRLYDPSAKYGEIFPLVYHAVVCPECWFASTDADFTLLPQGKAADALMDKDRRIADAKLIFPDADFTQPRGLMEGAASQYLVLRCYDFYGKMTSPTIKQGLASIRAAWLLDDLNRKMPDQHYDWVATLFRKKAQYFYNEALAREQRGIETMSAIKIYGPDTDKNYSYEGMLYMCAYLRSKFGPAHSQEERKTSLEDARRTIAKLFGMGKMSKDKPGAFLDLARTLYESINKQLSEMELDA